VHSLEPIEVAAPLYELDKSEVVRLGLELGVDYACSYSCLLGYERQCGRCPQCEKRRAAFAANEMEDPAGFKD
jgi:7-cyano-7-deazaguanine synthase